MGSVDRLVTRLVGLGATHVLGLPDNDSGALFAAVERHPVLRSLIVTREGEAFAIASGLWLGGARPVVAVQNTGLLESGDSLRGTALRMGVPLLCLVGYRGFGSLARASEVPRPMTHAEADSVALLTEPTLAAWRIPVFRQDPVAAAAGRGWEVVDEAWDTALRDCTPVGVLLEPGWSRC